MSVFVCGNVFGNDVGNGIGIVLGNVSALWVKYKYESIVEPAGCKRA